MLIGLICSWSCIILYFAPHALHCVIVTIFAYTIDHVEPKTEIQAEQVQRMFEGPQASSGEDTNLELNQGKPQSI
jgi:hypothetical protein